MDFDEILDAASAEAIATQLEPTAASTWRKICRTYSKKFNTPLPQVLALNPEEVALQVFEDNLDERDDEDNLIEHLLDLIYTMSDPEYAEKKSVELEQFIQETREEEAERLKEGRPIHPSLRIGSKNSIFSEATLSPQREDAASHQDRPRPIVDHPNVPATSGGVDLSHLEGQENER
jgi:hypothetical protein